MNVYRLCLFFFGFFVFNFMETSFADHVWMKNGDRLSGEIVRLTDGKLNLHTPYAGDFTLSWSEVLSLETDKEIGVIAANGDRFIGNFHRGENGEMTLASPHSGSIAIQKDNIAALVHPAEAAKFAEQQPAQAEIPSTTKELGAAKEKTADRTNIKKLWSGGVSLLGGARMGNREAFNLFVKSEAKRAAEKELLTLRANFGYGESEGLVDTTEASQQSNLRIFYAKDRYIFGDLKLEHDRFKDLDLRADGTLGAGYRFWKVERSELMGDIGFGLTEEIYRRGDNSTDASLRASIEYSQTLFEKSKLSQLLTVYPSLGDLGAVRFISETTFLTPISNSLSWTLNLTDEFDSQPSREGVTNNDISIRTGLQYSF
ncbi:MAG: DUF481 domain-containing protein [Candidatus Omnitrophota bacterium]